MKKFDIPTELGWRYLVRKPAADRKTYRVLKRWARPTRYETVTDKRIDSINAQFKKGLYNREQTERQLDLVIESLYKAAGVRIFKGVSNADNISVLNRFWEARYKRRRLVDKEGMYNDYRRAVEVIGELGLMSATEEELHDRLDERCEGNPKKRNRVISRLNTIFKYCRPDDMPHLSREREPTIMVNHISESELEQVLSHIKDDYLKIMVKAAFYSGCRQGELFALEPYHWKPGGQVQVLSQIDRKGVDREVKNTVQRVTAFTGPESVYRDWVKIKQWVTDSQRHKAWQGLQDACRKVFPDDKSKWLTFHDLRHCYAISLALAGVSIGHIARCLGNSEMVCEKYYARFVQKSETIDMIQRKFNEHKKRRP